MIEKFLGKRQIKLTIQNKITQENDSENFSLQTLGEMYYIGESCFITYEALNDSTEGAIKMNVRIKISEEGQLLVNRENAQTRMQLPLVLNKDTLAYYRMAGVNQIEMTSRLVFFDFGQTEELVGYLNCEYHLFTGDQLLGEYQLKLQYEPQIV